MLGQKQISGNGKDVRYAKDLAKLKTQCLARLPVHIHPPALYAEALKLLKDPINKSSMKNFSQKFAIKCTEKEYNAARVNGENLHTLICALGYDVSELRFFPSYQYIATPYKGKAGKLGSTATPSKDDRKVIEVWNADLFYALCCQKHGDTVSVGEWFTSNKTDNTFQCRDASKYDPQKFHKSTFEELVSRFLGTTVSAPDIEFFRPEPKSYKARKTNTVDADPESRTVLQSVIEAGTKIIEAEKGMSIEQMVGVAAECEVMEPERQNPIIPMPEEIARFNPTAEWIQSVLLPKTHLVQSLEKPVTPDIHENEPQPGPTKLVVKGHLSEEHMAKVQLERSGFIKTGKIQSVDSSTHFDLTPDITPQPTGPMTFKEILSWFGESNDVVLGWIGEGEIKCVPDQILSISRDFVEVIGIEKPVPFNQVYKSKESFLLHALTTLKQQA